MNESLKNKLSELYEPTSAGEKRFVKKHVVVSHEDPGGTKSKVNSASDVKPYDRKKNRQGYNSGEDEKVYESDNVKLVIDAFLKESGLELSDEELDHLSKCSIEDLSEELGVSPKDLLELSYKTLGNYGESSKHNWLIDRPKIKNIMNDTNKTSLEKMAEIEGHRKRAAKFRDKARQKYYGRPMKKDQVIESALERLEMINLDEMFNEKLEQLQESLRPLIISLYESLDDTNRADLISSLADEDLLEEIVDFALNENRAGNIAALTSIKTGKRVVRNSYALGKDSEIHDHGKIISHQNLEGKLNDALRTNGIATVHHNGVPVAHVRKTSDREYEVINHNKDDYQKYSKTRRGYGGKHYSFATGVLSKEQMHHSVRKLLPDDHSNPGGLDKQYFKTNKVSVHSYGPDKNRLETRNKKLRADIDSDLLTAHQQKAAEKFISSKLKNDNHTNEAKDIHSKIGAALESNDHVSALNHLEKLKNHIVSNSNHDRDKRVLSSAVNDYIKHKSEWAGSRLSNHLRQLKDSK